MINDVSALAISINANGDETASIPDFDGDGTIGFGDFVILAQNFGKEVPSSAVTIPDANLRAAIKNALGKASDATISSADMETLRHLDGEYAGISDLTGTGFSLPT